MDSKWNVESLYELMNERDKRYEQRFEAQEEAVRTAKLFVSSTWGYIIGAIGAIALVVTIFIR